jgi:CelD/BcsL family acetyltransferase involved in cellulose biosynthesis
VNAGAAAGPRAAGFRVGLDGLRSLREEWEALAQRSSSHAVSTSFPIYEALLRCRHPEPDRIHFFCIREPTNRLVAICPLELTNTRIRRLEFACWSSLSDPDRPCSSFLLDGLSDPQSIGAALLGSLREVAPRTRLISMERVVQGDETMSVLQGISPHYRVGSGPFLTILRPCPSGDGWLQKVSSKFRRNIRWGMRRMERLGILDYRVATEPGEVSARFTEFLQLEAAGWKGHAPNGRALSRKESVEQHALALVDAFTTGSGCELHGLWLDDCCIAALLCFRAGSELFAFKIARDERFKTYSVGHLLVFRVLSSLAERSEIHAVNFGWEAGWMEPWGGDKVMLSNVLVGLGGFSSRLAISLLSLPARSRLHGMKRLD